MAAAKKKNKTRAKKEQESILAETPLPSSYRHDYSLALAGLNLPPHAIEFINKSMADDPQELLDAVEAELTAVANEQFEQMRLEILAQEQERKLLWGNKFPRVLGQKPGDEAQKRAPGRPRAVPVGTSTKKGR